MSDQHLNCKTMTDLVNVTKLFSMSREIAMSHYQDHIASSEYSKNYKTVSFIHVLNMFWWD